MTCVEHAARGDCRLADFVAGGWCRYTCGHCGPGARGQMVIIAPGVEMPIESLVPLPPAPEVSSGAMSKHDLLRLLPLSPTENC